MFYLCLEVEIGVCYGGSDKCRYSQSLERWIVSLVRDHIECFGDGKLDHRYTIPDLCYPYQFVEYVDIVETARFENESFLAGRERCSLSESPINNAPIQTTYYGTDGEGPVNDRWVFALFG